MGEERGSNSAAAGREPLLPVKDVLEIQPGHVRPEKSGRVRAVAQLVHSIVPGPVTRKLFVVGENGLQVTGLDHDRMGAVYFQSRGGTGRRQDQAQHDQSPQHDRSFGRIAVFGKSSLPLFKRGRKRP